MDMQGQQSNAGLGLPMGVSGQAQPGQGPMKAQMNIGQNNKVMMN